MNFAIVALGGSLAALKKSGNFEAAAAALAGSMAGRLLAANGVAYISV